MAVDTWPASPTLPQRLLAETYSEGFADGRLVSQMETGPAKVRRRSSAMPRPIKGEMIMTAAQVASLRTFFNTTLIGGSLPFNFPDPITYPTTILVRFAGGVPAVSAFGSRYKVALDLEILP